MSTICTRARFIVVSSLSAGSKNSPTPKVAQLPKLQLAPLRSLRQRIDEIEIRDRKIAQFFAKAIPAQCPFERDIKFFGYKVAHIPPLCKLNPLYEQLVGLRFRSLCYLVDRCGIDIQPYL